MHSTISGAPRFKGRITGVVAVRCGLRVRDKEILGHNTFSINDYNLMDAMQKSVLIEQYYVIIRTLNEMLKK